MIDIAVEQTTNDLIFEEFDFFLFDGLDQIIQNLSIRLKFILGEWFLDITQGIPYFEQFFKKAPNLIQIDTILKEEIATTRGIAELVSFETNFNPRTRTFFVKFHARADGGEEILKELELPV